MQKKNAPPIPNKEPSFEPKPEVIDSAGAACPACQGISLAEPGKLAVCASAFSIPGPFYCLFFHSIAAPALRQAARQNLSNPAYLNDLRRGFPFFGPACLWHNPFHNNIRIL